MKKTSMNLLAASACLLWSSAFFSSKYCLSFMPPLSLAAIRLFVATAMLLFLVKFDKIKELKKYWKKLIVLSVLKTGIPFITFIIALSRVSGSLGALIIGSAPAISIIMATIFIPFEKLNAKKIVSLALGLSAIMLLSINKSGGSEKTQLIGILLMFLNVICSSYADIYVKKHMKIKSSIEVSFLQIGISAILVSIIAFFGENFSFNVFVENPRLFIGVGYLAFITAGASSIWLSLIQRPDVQISDIAMWKLLVPSVGAFLSWIFSSKDNPTLISIIALSLIMLSIFISVVKEDKLKKFFSFKKVKQEIR